MAMAKAYDGVAGDVVVEIELNQKHVVVRLIDRGNSLDLDTARAPDLDALPEAWIAMLLNASETAETSLRSNESLRSRLLVSLTATSSTEPPSRATRQAAATVRTTTPR